MTLRGVGFEKFLSQETVVQKTYSYIFCENNGGSEVCRLQVSVFGDKHSKFGRRGWAGLDGIGWLPAWNFPFTHWGGRTFTTSVTGVSPVTLAGGTNRAGSGGGGTSRHPPT